MTCYSVWCLTCYGNWIILNISLSLFLFNVCFLDGFVLWSWSILLNYYKVPTVGNFHYSRFHCFPFFPVTNVAAVHTQSHTRLQHTDLCAHLPLELLPVGLQGPRAQALSPALPTQVSSAHPFPHSTTAPFPAPTEVSAHPWKWKPPPRVGISQREQGACGTCSSQEQPQGSRGGKAQRRISKGRTENPTIPCQSRRPDTPRYQPQAPPPGRSRSNCFGPEPIPGCQGTLWGQGHPRWCFLKARVQSIPRSPGLAEVCLGRRTVSWLPSQRWLPAWTPHFIPLCPPCLIPDGVLCAMWDVERCFIYTFNKKEAFLLQKELLLWRNRNTELFWHTADCFIWISSNTQFVNSFWQKAH